MLIKYLRRFFAWVFYVLVDVEYLFKIREKRALRYTLKEIELGEGSKLSNKASVFNYRAKDKKIVVGQGSLIEGELLVFPYGGSISIGSNTYVGPGSRIWSGEMVDVGSNVLISHNVSISDSSAHELDHEQRALRFKQLMKDGLPKDKSSVLTNQIHIEDYAWINNDVIILRGVTIGKGAIVGAGSVVTKDVAPFTFVAGNPAIKIKDLIDETNS
ncbi:MAG: acyltransferase [Flavobacteriales bacterium]